MNTQNPFSFFLIYIFLNLEKLVQTHTHRYAHKYNIGFWAFLFWTDSVLLLLESNFLLNFYHLEINLIENN